MKAPDYRVDLVRDTQPSSASASGVAQSIVNQGSVKAQTTSNLIGLAGNTVFDAYKGKLAADFENKQEALKNEFIDPVVEAGQSMLGADKLKADGLVFAAQAADSFTASSILEGQDPDKVYEQAGQLFSKGQEATLKEYEQKVSNYENILSRFPGKQNEMFARSEKLLKEYISKMPGMADEFRKTSARILGRGGIESFTVTQAIDAVANFSSQQKEAAKQAQQQETEYRDAFKKSYVASGLGTDIEALNAWNSGARDEMYANIQANSNSQRRLKALDDSIKLGNTATSTGVSQLLSASTGQLMTGLNPLKSKLEQLGVSQKEIESGFYSEQTMNNPKVRSALENFSQTAVAGVRSQANSVRQLVAEKISSGEWRAENKSRKEMEDSINAWEKNTIETYIGDDKTGLTKALAAYTTTPKDRLDILNKNLDVYDKLTKIVGGTVPDDVRKQMFSSNPAVAKQIKELYPTLLPIKEMFNNIQMAFDDPVAFTNMLESVTKNTLPAGVVPVNKDQESSNALSVEFQTAAIETRIRQKNFTPEQSDVVMVADLVSKAAATETVGKVFLKKNLPTTKAFLDKLTPAQKQDAIEIITNNTNSVLMRHSEFAEQRINALKKEGGILSFKDSSGSTPLKLEAKVNTPVPDVSTPGAAADFMFPKGVNSLNKGTNTNKAVQIRPGTGVQVSTAFVTGSADLQSVMNHIDTSLTVRASITGESLLKLRKKFIQDATQVINTGGSFNLFNNLPEGSKAEGSRNGASTPTTSPASSGAYGILEGLRGLGYKNGMD